MAWGKTEEQKANDRAQRELQAYQASPVGLAESAAARGDRFFQVTIEASQIAGSAVDSFLMGFQSSATTRTTHAPDLLGRIEEQGWCLEHVGHVFVPTASETRDRVLNSGEVTRMSGRVEGIYLFRRAVDC